MTSNHFLAELAKRLKLKNFRGIFMRDDLPKTPLRDESGIMNFDLSDQRGSHWVAWYIATGNLFFFDSYGTAVPVELRSYLTRADTSAQAPQGQAKKIFHSDFMLQGLNSDICGELCITFIYLMDKGLDYKDVVNSLRPRAS